MGMAMRFEVPQFIDIKDKIFGPFTFAQFIFIVGGAGLGYIIIRAVPTVFKYVLAALPLALGLALAFFKYNGRPFTYTLQAFFIFLFSNKLYLWRQRPAAKKPAQPNEPEAQENTEPTTTTQEERLSDQRLRDLAWNLDILEK